MSHNEALPELWIIGYGDIGRRVARQWREQGGRVIAVARSVAAAGEAGLADRGVAADLDDPVAAGRFDCAGQVACYLAPPPRQGREDTRMRHFIEAISTGPPRRIVYLSTSGVYGDHGGALIDELTPPSPGADRAWRRLDAERQLGNFCRQNIVELVILRVGGIYGPGRLPLQRLLDGVPIIRADLAPRTNRIHADDLAAVCVAALRQGGDGEIYNVSDGTDSNMTEYFDLLADDLGLPRPPKLDWSQAKVQISPGMLSYLRESRRLDNRKMLAELDVKLRYPTLQSWLATGAARRELADFRRQPQPGNT